MAWNPPEKPDSPPRLDTLSKRDFRGLGCEDVSGPQLRARVCKGDAEMSVFADRKMEFKLLCQEHRLPVPQILPSLATDPCDYTDHEEVRLNIEAAGDIDPGYHVAHVWGHYLCCLHAWADDVDGGAEVTDMVADTIAGLVESAREMLK